MSQSLLLRSLKLNRFGVDSRRFPFSIPVIQNLESLEFHAPVTFFAGENGSGKSTLLEAIAQAASSITVGAEQAASDHSLSGVKPLADALKLVWSKRTRRGFFMRSEDFFGYTRRMGAVRTELEEDLRDVERKYQDRSPTARAFARSAYANELGALQHQYGQGLDAQSHGESYLKLFQARFVPDGLYLLDEPEAPLSPLRQLSFLVLLRDMVAQKAQFLIATHSPIIMAFPGAEILSFDHGAIQPIDYEALEHVQVTRTFLENPELYLRHLFA